MPEPAFGLLSQAEEIAQQFQVDDVQLVEITHHFVTQMKNGLNGDHPWQLPTFVTKLPIGTETGTFLAVDLGGTNCRVCAVNLHGDTTYTVNQITRPVPLELRIASSYRPLFAFIAGLIDEFLKSLPTGCLAQEKEHGYRLGFTFSFTCEQTSIASGTLIHWDKGWDIPEAIGKDPCQMLQEAIDDIGLCVSVCVLANDSVGTLVARSYTSPGATASTLAGVIFGTGTNAAYVENMSNIGRLSPEHRAGQGNGIMMVNTEWGCFGDNMKILPSTMYDDMLDMASTDPGIQMLEKRISGMYLGEILRRVLLHIHSTTGLDMTLNQDGPLFQPGAINSSLLSNLAKEKNSHETKSSSHYISSALGTTNLSTRDVEAIRLLSIAILVRAARLAGAALAAVILQSSRLEDATPTSKVQPQTTVAELTPSKSPPARVYRWLSSARKRLRRICATLLKVIITKKTAPQDRSNSSSSSQPTLQVPQQSTQAENQEGVIDIGVDGSLIEFCPQFEVEMRRALRDIPEIGPEGEGRVRIGLTKDGSGVGAALMAQAATTG